MCKYLIYSKNEQNYIKLMEKRLIKVYVLII